MRIDEWSDPNNRHTRAEEAPDPTEEWYGMVVKDRKAVEVPAAVEKGACGVGFMYA